MKKAIITILIILIAVYTSYSIYLVYRSYEFSNSPEHNVLIVYNKAYLRNYANILDAYKSVLSEEGIPSEAIEIRFLITTSAKKIAQSKPVIIFPDGLMQSMPEGVNSWIKEYLENKGNIAVIYDVGVKAAKGFFLAKSIFADIVGVNYITFQKLKENAYSEGYVKFGSKENMEYLQISQEKAVKDLVFGGYFYGKLKYPMARNEYIEPISKQNIYASLVTANGESYPGIIMKKYSNGNVLYVNLPLGHLKCSADDLPIRAILRTFLFKTIKISGIVK